MKPTPGNTVSPLWLEEPNITHAEYQRGTREAGKSYSLQGALEACWTLRLGTSQRWGKGFGRTTVSSRGRRACLASGSSPYSWMGKMVSPNGGARFPVIYLDLLCTQSLGAAHLQLWSFPCPCCALVILNTLNRRKLFHTYFPCHQTRRDSWVGKTHPVPASSV